MPLSWAEVVKRAVLFVFVVAVIVGGAAGAANVLVPTPGVDNASVPKYPAFDAEKLAPDRVEDIGGIDTPDDVDVGVVVVDRAHDNRFQRGDITGLERAITQAGGELRYLGGEDSGSGTNFEDTNPDLNQSLAGADAFVIANPGKSYTDDELNALEDFVDSGGRILLLGEPNYNEVQFSGFQAQIVTKRNFLGEVGSRFGLAFGTEYLVNMDPEGNDAIYKNIQATAGDGELSAGIDTAVFYTATTVAPTGDGTALLVGAEGTRLARGGGGGSYPVAALNAEGTVLGVGDTTFMEESKHNVADNEVVLGRLARFLAQGDADYTPPTERFQPPERNTTEYDF